MSIRKIILLCVTAAFAWPLLAFAQEGPYPNRPVRVIVPFAPGGLADLTYRLMGEKLSVAMGKPFVIENMPGAGGVVAANTVLRSKPDGHTLLVFSSGTVLTKLLYKNVPYDVQKDLAPVAYAAHFDLIVLVRQDSRFRTMADLVAATKANPGKLNVGTINPGSTQYLSAELLKTAANLDFAIVPFKTTPEAYSAMLGGQVDAVMESYATARALVDGGRARVLVSTGAKRSGYLPQVPTMAEAGIQGVEVIGWNALGAPAGTPKEIISALNQQISLIVAMPDVRKKLLDMGTDAYAGTPEEVSARVTADLKKWTAIFERTGLQPQ